MNKKVAMAAALAVMAIAAAFPGAVSSTMRAEGYAGTWRDVADVEFINNGTHFTAVVKSPLPVPQPSDDMLITRTAYIYVDKDMNASTGLYGYYTFGAEIAFFVTHTVGLGSSGRGFRADIYAPNATLVDRVMGAQYMGYSDYFIDFTIPLNEVGIGNDMIKAVDVSYYTTLADGYLGEVNATVPHLPNSDTSDESKWAGIEPVVTDEDLPGDVMRDLENLTHIYMGYSGDALIIRAEVEGNDTSWIPEYAGWSQAILLVIDHMNDGTDDYMIWVYRYPNGFVRTVISNATTRQQFDWRKTVIEYRGGTGKSFEVAINASFIGMDLSSNSSVRISEIRLSTIVSNYVGMGKNRLTRYYITPGQDPIAVTPLNGVITGLSRDRYVVYTPTFSVDYYHAGTGYVYTYGAEFGEVPRPTNAAPPAGNLTNHYYLWVWGKENLNWPTKLYIKMPAGTLDATAYYLDINEDEYVPFSQQSLNQSTGELTIFLTKEEFGNNGELIFTVSYEPGEVVTTTTTTTTTPPITTTTATTTIPTTITTTTSPITTTTTTTTSPVTTTTTTSMTQTTTTSTSPTITTTTSPATTSSTTTIPATETTTPAQTTTQGTTATTSGEEAPITGTNYALLGALLALIVGIGVALFMLKRRSPS